MKVLIAVDDSAYSTVAVDYVVEQCWPKDSEFNVVTVVEPLYIEYASEGGYIGAALDAQEELNKQAKKLVREKMEQLKKRLGSDRVLGTTIEGQPAFCILELAESWQADLIVVGSHGRRGFKKLFLGSVAENVARHAQCSVEVVKRIPRMDEEKTKSAVA